MENDNNFGYEKITILVDIIPLRHTHIISTLLILRLMLGYTIIKGTH